jgi:hypothetical protein
LIGVHRAVDGRRAVGDQRDLDDHAGHLGADNDPGSLDTDDLSRAQLQLVDRSVLPVHQVPRVFLDGGLFRRLQQALRHRTGHHHRSADGHHGTTGPCLGADKCLE